MAADTVPPLVLLVPVSYYSDYSDFKVIFT